MAMNWIETSDRGGSKDQDLAAATRNDNSAERLEGSQQPTNPFLKKSQYIFASLLFFFGT